MRFWFPWSRETLTITGFELFFGRLETLTINILKFFLWALGNPNDRTQPQKE